MTVVLGVDAAWTATQPSGVALVQRKAGRWELVAVASSYPGFVVSQPRAAFCPTSLHSQSASDLLALLATASQHCGRDVDLIAVDMPLSQTPITGRRKSDNEVSRLYGARKCSTHSPNASRPGTISDTLVAESMTAGYPLWTTTKPPVDRALVEVYPHPALVELAGAPERLRYKVGKRASYWPAQTQDERKASLARVWTHIVELLDERIAHVKEILPPLSPTATAWEMKAYEDALDAVVCAWVGTCVLEGDARPLGDEASAIWVPRPVAASHSSPTLASMNDTT